MNMSQVTQAIDMLLQSVKEMVYWDEYLIQLRGIVYCHVSEPGPLSAILIERKIHWKIFAIAS